MRYLARRLLHGVLLLWAVTLLTFLLAELVPGDLFAELRLEHHISEETVELLRERWGLEDPWPTRYLRWLASIASGELGWSFVHDRPVGELVWYRVGRTLLLSIAAMLLAWGVAIPLGAAMAAHRGGWLDRGGSAFAALLLAIPELLLGLGAFALAARTGWFPLGGMSTLGAESLATGARVRDLLWHLALPVTALALTSLPSLLRHVRSAVAEALDAPHVEAARGHGIPARRRLLIHALPAAAHPLIALFGVSFAGLLSGALVIEVVFSWPGLGPFLIDAILARDLHVILAITLLSGALLIAGNLLADVLLLVVDPRIREGVEE